jgi:hypothetical protein
MRGITLAALLTVGSLIPSAATAGDCGCDRPACATCNAKVTIQVCEKPACCHKPHCLHHRCRHCCEQPSSSPQSSRGGAPPSGPIYESMGVSRGMPMMSMPVMMASYPVMSRGAVYEEPPPRRESSCASSASEIELLKERFERLHSRVNTLQQAMDDQTEILKLIASRLPPAEGEKASSK